MSSSEHYHSFLHDYIITNHEVIISIYYKG